MSPDSPVTTFRDLSLGDPLLKALDDVGYETPSPIQAQTIPALLAGRDLVGQAQTGTGKTAAFALPLLARIDLSSNRTQGLVLAPTRELAIQVAEAFQSYAAHLKGFHVLPIYGGQDYGIQLRALKRGAHVVVGTPGRVMDHMRRGTLNLEALQTVVLDEADEMLRMGFIDDVEWVLSQTPAQRQVALFSATMPDAIRRIAKRHLKDPAEITIKQARATADTIRQRFWMVSGLHKLDALTRILEGETFDGMIVFVRTKNATTELAERLQARGYAAEALNGDIGQAQRERTVERLKSGKIDILVATDVAARGLDVERVSHIVNYDIPYDTESYVHRIGRTGRAGRKGDAILFVEPREKRLLYAIEKTTRQRIEAMELPSTEIINDQRIARFKQRISDTLATEEIGFFYQLVEQYQQEHNVPAMEIAAALAVLLQGDQPLLLEQPRAHAARHAREPAAAGEKPRRERAPKTAAPERGQGGFEPRPPRERAPHRDEQPPRPARERRGAEPLPRREREPRAAESKPRARRDTGETLRLKGAPQEPRVKDHAERAAPGAGPRAEKRPPRPQQDVAMERFRIEVGRTHGVQPGNIVGAIANEAGLENRYIGRIEIQDTYSTVELPAGMPGEIFTALKNAWVSGRRLQISRLRDGETAGGRPAPKPARTPRRATSESAPARRRPGKPPRQNKHKTRPRKPA